MGGSASGGIGTNVTGQNGQGLFSSISPVQDSARYSPNLLNTNPSPFSPDFGVDTPGTINGMEAGGTPTGGSGMVGPPTQPGPGQTTPLGGMLSSPPPTGGGTVQPLAGALGSFGSGGPPTQPGPSMVGPPTQPGPGQGMPGMVGPPTQPFGGGQQSGMSLFGGGQQNQFMQELINMLRGGQ